MTKSNRNILCVSMAILLLSFFACQKNNLNDHHPIDGSQEALLRSDSTISDTLKLIKPSNEKIQVVKDVIQNEWTFEEYLNTYHTLGGLLWNQAHKVSRNTLNDDYLITIPFMKNDSISAILFNLYSDGQHSYDIVERTALDNGLSELVDTYGYDHTAIILSSFINHQLFYNDEEYEHDKLEELLSQPAAAYRCFYWQRICHEIVVTVPGSGLPPLSRYDCYYKLVGGGCGGGGGVNIPVSSGRPESGGGGGVPTNTNEEDNGGVSWEAPEDCTAKLAPWLEEHVNSLSFHTPCANKTTDEIVSKIMSGFCDTVDPTGQDASKPSMITKEMLDEELARYDQISKKNLCPIASCVLDELLSLPQDTSFCNILHGFNGSDKMHLIIESIDLRRNEEKDKHIYGRTIPQIQRFDGSKVFNIYIDIKLICEATDMIRVAETLIHESIHAELFSIAMDAGWDGSHKDQGAFLEVWNIVADSLYGGQTDQHAIMLREYLDRVAKTLRALNGGQHRLEDYYYIIYEGIPEEIRIANGITNLDPYKRDYEQIVLGGGGSGDEEGGMVSNLPFNCTQ